MCYGWPTTPRAMITKPPKIKSDRERMMQHTYGQGFIVNFMFKETKTMGSEV